MKVLLVAINAKYIHSNLAVYSLRSYANKYSKYMGLIELTINHNDEDVLKAIYREKADVVAFSCYIWNISMVKRISAELKKVQPNIIIWYGGPEVSYDARETLLELKHLDGIMVGEGEQTFLELMEHYVEGNTDLSSIAGLAYKNKDSVVVTGDRGPMALDLIPFPYGNMEEFTNRIIYYESSRGCPFLCSYCLSSIEKKVRFRSSELVKKELQLFLDHKTPQVKFVDRTFNCNKKHAMDIWSFVKEHDNGITNFHFELSADLLEEDEIAFLATLRPGQVQFEIGVQTTNPDTAEAIHRKMDFEILSSHVNRIKAGKNIHQHLDLIAGLPKEDYRSFEKSFQDVYRLKPDQLQLGFLKILKGSAMEADCRQFGIVYRDTPPYEVLSTDSLSYEELLRLKGVCDMAEVYYNSGQFTYTIRYLEHYYQSPMQLYQALSDYYESMGYAMASHSRIRRYEILQEFFKAMQSKSINEPADKAEQEATAEQIALFEELLVLDVFLREDMKSRPAFAGKAGMTNLRLLYEKYHSVGRNIHIEPFRFDVMECARTGRVIQRPMLMLFDYGNRDPLNKGAKLVLLEDAF